MRSISADDLTRPELEALLRWYVEAGVDIAVDDAPHDRFAEFVAAQEARAAGRADEDATGAPSDEQAPRVAPGRRAPLPRPAAPPPPPTAAAIGAEQAVQTATALAASAQNLDDLRAALESFDACALKRTAMNLVFGDGDPKARLVFVSDAPGADEDREGLPLAGRPGRLFDRMLASIGLERSQVYVTGVIPWRPPGARKPTPQEVAMCLPFVRRQIELVAPDVLVCLGGAPSEALLNVKDGITRARGRAYEYAVGQRNIAAMATLHPDFLLRQPLNKRLAWHDLRQLRRTLETAG